MSRRVAQLLLAVVALLALPVLAAGAPARTGTLSAAEPSYEWKGPATAALTRYVHTVEGRTVAVGCEQPVAKCDDTLLKIDTPGATELVVGVAASTGTNDYDLYVYESTAAGAPGAAVGASAKDAPLAESVTVKSPKAAFYLARIVYYDTGAVAPAGSAKLTGLVAPAPAPAGTPAPGPDPTPPPNPEPTPAPTPSPTPTGFQPEGDRPQDDTLRAGISVRSTSVRASRSRGVAARLQCSTACRARMELRVSAGTARRLGLGRRETVIGRGRVEMAQAGHRDLRVKFSRKAGRALRGAKSLRMILQAAVNTPKGSQPSTLRRGAKLSR